MTIRTQPQTNDNSAVVVAKQEQEATIDLTQPVAEIVHIDEEEPVQKPEVVVNSSSTKKTKQKFCLVSSVKKLLGLKPCGCSSSSNTPNNAMAVGAAASIVAQ
jgi:hypothetical protein